MSHQKTQTEVIQTASHILEQNQLESCYQEANQEINLAFDITASDELDDETW